MFSVHGVPVAQPRHKVAARGKFAHAYIPKEHPIHAWKDSVRESWKATGDAYLEGPICFGAIFYLPRPMTHYRTGKFAGQLKPSAPKYPAARGTKDGDNMAKAVTDALEGVAYDDDCQITEWHMRKRYIDELGPRAVITLAEIR